MNTELDGVRRTFPKKPNGMKKLQAGAGYQPQSDANLIQKHRRKKSVSKAKKKKKAMIFAAKIEKKKRILAERKKEFENGNEVDVEDMLSEGGDRDSKIIRGQSEDIDVQSDTKEDLEEFDDEKPLELDPDEHEDFREEIANMPLGKAKELREKLGLKLFNKAFFGEASSLATHEKTRKNFARDNPKRPREVPSRRPVSKYRNVFENERGVKKRFDPRFDERCGRFDEHIYQNNYSFLNEIRNNEKKILQEEIKKTAHEDPEKAERMKEVLRRITNREKSQAQADLRKKVIREIRHENNERMRQGLKPIFKTRAQIRMRIMEEKFKELQKTNQLDKYIARRAKKQNKKKQTPI